MSEGIQGSLGSKELPSCGSPTVSQPAYVVEALRGLTRAQKMYVKDGYIHGDVTVRTIRALQDKALFYLIIDSPNGRCGHLGLTPLGKTVRSILLAREGGSIAAEPPQKAQPQKDPNHV